MTTRKFISGKPLLYWVTLIAIIAGLALGATSGAVSAAAPEQQSDEIRLVPEPFPPGIPA